MANDRNSERERRIREMLRRKDNGQNPNELGILSQGQAEVQGIQDELANDLQMQQAREQSRLQSTGFMAQAAEGMLAMDQGGQQVLSGQVGRMNQGTQAIMQKYGVKPQSTTQTQSNNFRSSTGAGTMNIKNEYVTNNKTEVRITQPQIPLSQPNIPVSAPTIKTEDKTIKFKTWLSGMFAKQQNEADIQRKEFRKKEWALARNTTRLMRRIEEASKNMTARLDPQRMTSTLGGQLKWLLLLFGATMITKVWKPAMNLIENIEGGFRAAFGLPVNADLRKNAQTGLSIIDKIKSFIGIKPNDTETTLIGGIGKVFTQGIQKLIDRIDFWFEDRAIALREIKMPEINLPKIEVPGFGGLLEGMTDTLKGVGQYIGDMITVALGGSKGRVQAASNHIRSKSIDTFKQTGSSKRTAGDDGLVRGKGRDYMRDSDFGIGGILKGNASSTQAMSRAVGSLMNDRSNISHSAEIASGVQQLFDVANRQGQVVIDPEFLANLGLNRNDINQLRAQKGLVPVQYKLIQVHPSRAQYEEDGLSTHFNQYGAGLTGAGAGLWAGAKMGAAGGSFFGPIGTATGAIGGALVGGVGGYILGSGIGSGVDATINEKGRNNLLVSKLVPIDSSEVSDDGSPAIPKTMFALTKRGADAVTAKVMAGARNKEMSLTNKEFYERIRKAEEMNKRRNGIHGPLKSKMDLNELREAQATYDARQREYYERFESKDPNSINQQLYGNYNTAIDNITSGIGSLAYAAGGFIHGVATSLVGGNGRKYCTTSELNRRANYCMKFFMDRGLTKAQAAGIVGNLAKEGLMMKDLGQEIHDVNGPSAGIAMFHDVAGRHGHLSALKQFAQERGLNWKDLDTQLQYLWEGSLGGKQVGKSVIDQIRQLQGSDQDVAERASFIWGDKYEVFRGHQNWNDSSHQARRNASLGIMKNYDKENIGYTKFESTSGPILKLNGVSGTTELPDTGIGRVAWLGDSQSCVASCGFPKGVSAGLSEPLAYFSITGASPSSYFSSDKKGQVGTNIKSLAGKSGKEALTYIAGRKPEYCIIALGHFGISGLQKVIDVLETVGIKVIVIKMWPISGKSEKEMSEMYNNIRAYGWVDLSWLNVSKSQDGKLINSKGCSEAASEVVHQLKTGTVSSLDPDRAPVSDLQATMTDLVDSAGRSLGLIGKEDTIRLNNFTNGMTAEQRAIYEKAVNRMSNEEIYNTRSWESMGAVTDQSGTFFRNGDYKAYVRTDGDHNGLFGLRKGDIDYITVEGSNKKLTDTELELAMNSMVYSVNSIFNDYQEKTKGQGYNDTLTDNKNNLIFYHLGKFNDLDSFSPTAIEDFGGEIDFYICPTKDLKRWNVVSIGKRIKCSANVISKDGNLRYYGPIIYHKGAHWIKPKTDPSQKIYTDYQPICLLMNVKLTPKGYLEASRLLSFLNDVGEITEKNNNFYDKDGRPLSEYNLKLAKKYGAIVYSPESKKAIVSNEYNNRILSAKNFNKSSLDMKKYHEDILKIKGTKEERQAFYKNNKNLFRSIDGKVYGPNGLEWGTVDNSGKISFYDNETFKSVAESSGEFGIKNNLRKINNYDSEQIASGLGIVSREKMADFLFKSQTASRDGVKIRKGIEDMRNISGIRRIRIGSKYVNIPYRAFYKSDGTVFSIRTNISDIENAISPSVIMNYDTKLLDKNQNLTAKSLNEFDSKLVNFLNSNTSITKETNFLGNETNKARAVDSLNKNDTFKQLIAKRLVGEGKEISRIDNRYIYLKNGEKILHNNIFAGENPSGWIKTVNKAIFVRNSQVNRQITEDSFKASGLEDIYKSFAEKANKNEMKYNVVYDNYVSSESGDVFGKIGKNNKIVALNSSEAKRIALDYFNKEGVRQDYYQQALGLKKINGNYFYEKGGKRVQLDLSKDIKDFRNIRSLMKQDTVQVLEDGEWKSVGNRGSSEVNSILLELSRPLNNMVKSENFTNKMIHDFSKAVTTSLSLEAKDRVKQGKIMIDQKVQQEKHTKLLEIIAQKNTNDDVIQILKEIEQKGETEKKMLEGIENFAARTKINPNTVRALIHNGKRVYYDADFNGDKKIDEKDNFSQTVQLKDEFGNNVGKPVVITNNSGNTITVYNTATEHKYRVSTVSGSSNAQY